MPQTLSPPVESLSKVGSESFSPKKNRKNRNTKNCKQKKKPKPLATCLYVGQNVAYFDVSMRPTAFGPSSPTAATALWRKRRLGVVVAAGSAAHTRGDHRSGIRHQASGIRHNALSQSHIPQALRHLNQVARSAFGKVSLHRDGARDGKISVSAFK